MPAPPELGSRLAVAVARTVLRTARIGRPLPTPRRGRSGSTRCRRATHSRRSTGRARAELCIVGGGFTGLWAALHAKEQAARARRRAARGDALRRRRQRAQRRLRRQLADPRAGQRPGPLPARSSDALEAARGDATSTRSPPTSTATGSTLSSSRVGEISVALEPHQVPELEAGGRAGPPLRPRRASCSTPSAMRAEVGSPLYQGGLWRRTGAGAGQPGPARRRACAGRRLAAGVHIHEGSPVTRAGVRGRGRGRADRAAGGSRPSACCWPPAPTRRSCGRSAATWRPVYDYVLMTEPLDARQRAAVGWRAAPGDRRHGQPVSLLPPRAPTTGSCGAAMTPSTATADRSPRATTSTTPPSPASPSTSSRPSPSWRGCASATAGAARSTPAAASPCSSATRCTAAPSTRSATPGSASAPAASAGAPGSTCSTAGAPRPPGSTLVRRRPLPFPPEPLRSAVIQLTRHQLAAADRSEGPARAVAARARPAGPGLRQLTRSGSRPTRARSSVCVPAAVLADHAREPLMHERDGHRALADRRRDALDRAGVDVADGEDARAGSSPGTAAGRRRRRRAARLRGRGRSAGSRARRIATRPPSQSVCGSAPMNTNSGLRLELAPLAGARSRDDDRLQRVLAAAARRPRGGSSARPAGGGRARRSGSATSTCARSSPRIISRQLRGVLREEHRRLAGRVAAADDQHRVAGAHLRLGLVAA